MKWRTRRKAADDDLHEEVRRVKNEATEQMERAHESTEKLRNHLRINHFGELLLASMGRR